MGFIQIPYAKPFIPLVPTCDQWLAKENFAKLDFGSPYFDLEIAAHNGAIKMSLYQASAGGPLWICKHTTPDRAIESIFSSYCNNR